MKSNMRLKLKRLLTLDAVNMMRILFCIILLLLFTFYGVAQKRIILNSSFESPGVSANTFRFIPQAQVSGWSTTDTRGQIEFWGRGFQGVIPQHGNQFVELNANSNGRLSQEVCMFAGETFTWSLWHRARQSGAAVVVDTMRLLIDGVEQGRFGSGTRWTNYTGTYTLAGPSRNVVFAFEAVRTSTGDPTAGNFLDNIQITGLKAYPSFDPAGYSVVESNPNPSPLLLINGEITIPSTVSVRIVGGAAVDGIDYTINPMLIQVPPGLYDGTAATGIVIPLNLIDDQMVESNETIVLEIDQVAGDLLLLNDACKPVTIQTTFTILDDDCPAYTIQACTGTPVSLSFTHNNPRLVNWYDHTGVQLLLGNQQNYTPVFQQLPDTIYAHAFWGTGALSRSCRSQYIIEQAPFPVPHIDHPVSPVCPQSTQVYSAELHAGSRYQWSVLNGHVLSQSVQQGGEACQIMFFDQPVRLQLTEIDSRGCKASIVQDIDMVDVAIPRLVGKHFICLGDVENYTVLNQGGIYTWQLIEQTGTASMSTNAHTAILSATGVGLVELQVTKEDQQCLVSDTLVVEIVSLPVLMITTPDRVCVNDPLLKLTASPMGGAFSGSGVNTSVFNPKTPGLSLGVNNFNTITYQYTDARGCTNRTTKDLVVIENPSVEIVIDRSMICAGEAAHLSVHHVLPDVTYRWYKDHTRLNRYGDLFTTDQEGVYHVEANYYGCTALSNQERLTLSKVWIDAGGPYEVRENKSLVISPTYWSTPVQLPVSFEWISLHDGSTLSSSLSLTLHPFRDTSYYEVKITNSLGCEATSKTVVLLKRSIVIPQIFSPNGDGLNDYWIVSNIEAYRNSVTTVYNRWGSVVHREHHYQNNWDGKLSGVELPVATYYYVIELNDKDDMEPYTGSVTIVR